MIHINLYGLCYLIFASFYAIITGCLKWKEYIPEKKHLKVIEIVPGLLLAAFTIYKSFSDEYQMCEFHYDCYEDETMQYTSITYGSYNKCITSNKFSNVIIDYYEEYGSSEECSGSEYGCCEISNSCQTSYEYNMSAPYYQNHYTLVRENVGMISTYITKNNPEGDNCLTYNDYIDFYEYTEMNDIIMIYLLALYCYIIYYSIIVCVNHCKCKEKGENGFEPVVQATSV